MKRGFGSDNHSPTHPQIMNALLSVNEGHEPAYGTDSVSERSYELLREIFGEGTEAHFVFTGTAANVLALGACVRPHHAILASEHAHIVNDECGAPERNLGCKVLSVPTPDGKLTPEAMQRYLIRRGDQHASQVRAISITQPTELGTVYTLDEIRAITAFAKRERLLVHLDGARLVNAAASLGCSLREMTTDLGIDVLSLGGTKNGLMFGEAVIFPRAQRGGGTNSAPSLSEDFKFARKQLMQLPSKTRFIAAQFNEFLGTDLWLKNARHANSMAKRLAEGLARSRFAELTQKTQANACFVRFPKKLVSALREQAFFYVWDERTFECRLMMSWDTQESDIDLFLEKLESVGKLAEKQNE